MKNLLFSLVVLFLGLLFLKIASSFLFVSGAPFLFTVIALAGFIILAAFWVFPMPKEEQKRKLKNNEERQSVLHEASNRLSDESLPDEFWFGAETDSLNIEGK